MAKTLPTGMREKNGRIEYRFMFDGRRYSVYGSSVRQCLDKEKQRIQELEQGTYKRGKQLTISEYFEQWVEEKRDSVRETTLRNNRLVFKSMSNITIDKTGKSFGNMRVTDIEPQIIRCVRDDLKSRMATRTVNDSLSLLKSLFKTAIDEGIITRNPVATVKGATRTEPLARDTIHRALTIDETRQFLEASVESYYHPLYVFLLHTGLRIGEAGALLPSDIDDKGIRVNKTLTRTEVGGYAIGKGAKTSAGNRFVPLDDAARSAIREQRKQSNALGHNVIDMTQPVFRVPRGSFLKSSIVNTDIKMICDRVGIDKFTVHAFRDTFATRCVESGMQPKVLQEIMGHSSIKITLDLYAHAMDETKEEQLKVVNFG